jgi:hypothetical protein
MCFRTTGKPLRLLLRNKNKHKGIEMSQHYFNTTHNSRPARVQAGWDRPLLGFYMIIDYTDGNCAVVEDDDGYLYDNISDEKLAKWMGLPPEFDYFIAKLKDLGIDLPVLMIDQIMKDSRLNVGNRTVCYDATGSITMDSAAEKA